jgi:hypothetical protein
MRRLLSIPKEELDEEGRKERETRERVRRLRKGRRSAALFMQVRGIFVIGTVAGLFDPGLFSRPADDAGCFSGSIQLACGKSEVARDDSRLTPNSPALGAFSPSGGHLSQSSLPPRIQSTLSTEGRLNSAVGQLGILGTDRPATGRSAPRVRACLRGVLISPGANPSLSKACFCRIRRMSDGGAWAPLAPGPGAPRACVRRCCDRIVGAAARRAYRGGRDHRAAEARRLPTLT